MRLTDIIERFNSRFSPLPGRIYNLAGSSMALFLALRLDKFLMVEDTEEHARKLYKDVLFYRRLLGLKDGLHMLPPANGPETAGERAALVHDLFIGEPEGGEAGGSIITSVAALSDPLWPPTELRERELNFGISLEALEVERASVEKRLHELGYERTATVTDKGQFSMRGFILDVFPSAGEGGAGPFRLEFFGDVIESIKTLDIETQRSQTDVGGFMLLPAGEPALGISPEELLKGHRPFFSESVAPPEAPEGATVLSALALAGEGVDAGLSSMGGLGLLPEERKGVYELPAALKRFGGETRILIVSSSGWQAERFKQLLMEGDIVAPVLDVKDQLLYEGNISIITVTGGRLSEGFYMPGLLVLTEKEIIGERPEYRAIRKSRVAGLLAKVDDLAPGDYVVHGDYGIGRFEGLTRQSIEGGEYELMAIGYAEGNRLYLPLYAIDRIRKYRAREGVEPKIDRLGTLAWQRTKERVRKKLKEMAGKLLKLYAEREMAEGFAFSPDTEFHREFDSFFTYEETPDQTRSIGEIKQDMESPRPMDRLLCGDVGYGKTEVAMRAVFKALYDGKQAAVLVPTTLLCEQHYRIFKKRFSAFPVTVDYLSRFKSKKEQRETLKAIERGRVDVVIATHSLLGGGVSFSGLGLLIIDEEHRFGVRQKERLKELSKGVDVLTLTATPIPRTLQMALSGIRKMSVIETPPEERLAVKSTVAVFDERIVKEAVEKELERQGQVFFVHNRIQDIEKVAGLIRRLAPVARVAVAHGRMPERDLEKIMLSFLNRELDMLVSTAIIGSGLDIPTANTILIDMAHRMGLADLYQLKGRVGRSNVRAFAYYLIPAGQPLDEEARKRLQAIQEMSYMGAGLRLAMKDLEIRGAGNLLGAEQSGFIDDVGFDMYIEMLERAVSELRGIEVKEAVRPSVRLSINAFIPEDYIEDAAVRLGTYRAIASARGVKDLDELEAEMADRFGRPPEPAKNLLRVMRLNLMARGLQISEIRQTDHAVRFTFTQEARISAERLMGVFKRRIRFHAEGFELPVGEGWDVYEETKKALEALEGATGPSSPALKAVPLAG